MSTVFQQIPILDFSAFNHEQGKVKALQELKSALFDVGFLYLTNTGLEAIIEEGHERTPQLFDLPQAEKDACNMINSPAFVGYTVLGAETTASRTDLREQFDFGTAVQSTWKSGAPQWKRLNGPSQYPNQETEKYVNKLISKMSDLSTRFLELVSECLDLPKDTLAPFRSSMDRLKLIKYPPAEPGTQGVGPHKDSTNLFTFLSQDSVGGLQVLNKAGEWIDAVPVKGSLVVNVAQGFEAITGGLCPATAHRVVAPQKTTRYSIPFFLGVRFDLTLDQLRESAADICKRVPASGKPSSTINHVASEFLSPKFSCLGEAALRNRVVSHPDVGQKWYPELSERYSREQF